MKQVDRWIEITFILVLVYLVVANAQGFASAVRAIASGYSEGVRSLQGRG